MQQRSVLAEVWWQSSHETVVKPPLILLPGAFLASYQAHHPQKPTSLSIICRLYKMQKTQETTPKKWVTFPWVLCVQNVSLWHFKCWAHTYIHEFSRRQCQPLSLNVVVLIFSLTLVAKMKQWYTYMQQKSKRTYLYAVVVLGIQSNLSQSQ